MAEKDTTTGKKSMKIFTGTQIKELDRYTIEHEPIGSIDLMERAARAIAEAIRARWTAETPVVVFAGSGNNGGDALAVARMLAGQGYEVEAFLFNIKGSISPDCAANRDRLKAQHGVKAFTEVTMNFEPPRLTAETLVVDGLFGSGLSRPLEGGFASLVRYINASPAQVVSIDLPSGLMPEDNTGNPADNIVRADVTLTLQQKKLSMLLADCQPMVGQVEVLDIGISQEAMAETPCAYLTIDETRPASMLPRRDAFAHKGTMGNALLVAGSYGMAGAAVLAARACLRSGVGKVTVATPSCNRNILQIAVPEAVLAIDRDEQVFTQAVDSAPFGAIGMGPGLGQDEDSAMAMLEQVQQAACPVVMDADALNQLGRHRVWQNQLPQGLILTPHPREFDRIAGNSLNDFDRLSQARDLAERLQAYIVLKGHHTALCSPDGSVVFNTTGNAGMATAGSGDVLTGIITALLARGLSRREACLLGIYLHGLAGDLAAQELGQESLVASDIVGHLPAAFRHLQNERTQRTQ